MRASSRIVIIMFCSILIVSVSGCTIPGPSMGGGGGVVITDFAPEFSDYYLGEPVSFRLRIKNTGSSDARNVVAEVLNLEGWEQVVTTDCRISEMLAPNPDMGTSGEIKICTFKFKAPNDLPQGLSFTYNPIVRLTYEYESATVKSITIASQSELRRLQDTGKALPADTVSTSSGPVSISIETKGPIRYWEDLGSMVFPIETRITNVGGGTVQRQESVILEGVNKLKVETTLPEDMIPEDPQCGNSEIELWQGRSYELVCKIRATDLRLSAPVQKVITVEALYRYNIDQQIPVTIKWRET